MNMNYNNMTPIDQSMFGIMMSGAGHVTQCTRNLPNIKLTSGCDWHTMWHKRVYLLGFNFNNRSRYRQGSLK